jgi:hypothetical protein
VTTAGTKWEGVVDRDGEAVCKGKRRKRPEAASGKERPWRVWRCRDCRLAVRGELLDGQG